ncbi:unnamed protein product [Candida verbasci]|uniref:Endonuclease/exonuclease/phosphatase domain-containing protein n=1 Tax=Candida verbasci TaxID=1227364 RepID=A0A9W4TTW9_9ASCO|nr:unnamed protein product [Candida verbasci]
MQAFNALKKVGKVFKEKKEEKQKQRPLVYDKAPQKPNANVQSKATAPPPTAISKEPLDILIYTHNIRLDTQKLMVGEKPWKYRKDGVVRLIKQVTSEHYPVLIGLQEVLYNQLIDIMNKLGSNYTYFGVGRDDGGLKGEFSPIIYNKLDWELIEGKTYWLSETPEKPSKSWDSALNRIVVSVVVKHKKTNKVVNFYNTHYDHKGKQARIESSKLILQIMDRKIGDSILVGDFNSEPNSGGYQILDEHLHETSKYAENKAGGEFTCVGFNDEGESIIDFIWVSKKLKVLSHEVIMRPNGGEDCNCSDHLPIKAIVEI